MTRSTGDQLWTGLSGVLCQFAMRVGDAMSHRKADYPVGDDHRNEPEEGKKKNSGPETFIMARPYCLCTLHAATTLVLTPCIG